MEMSGPVFCSYALYVKVRVTGILNLAKHYEAYPLVFMVTLVPVFLIPLVCLKKKCFSFRFSRFLCKNAAMLN